MTAVIIKIILMTELIVANNPSNGPDVDKDNPSDESDKIILMTEVNKAKIILMTGKRLK